MTLQGWRFWSEPMVEADIDDVRELERQSFTTTWQEGAFRNELKTNPCAHYIVMRAQQPEQSPIFAGYAGFWLVEDEAHITSIAVSPALRGQGAGKKLLFAMLELTRKLKGKWATLEVRDDNIPAQKLYKRFGFAKVGTRKKYYEGTVDGWVMWAGNLLSESYTDRLYRICPEEMKEAARERPE